MELEENKNEEARKKQLLPPASLELFSTTDRLSLYRSRIPFDCRWRRHKLFQGRLPPLAYLQNNVPLLLCRAGLQGWQGIILKVSSNPSHSMIL